MILKYKENSSKELKDMVFFAMNNYIEGLDCFCIQLDDIIEISAKVKNIIGYIFLVAEGYITVRNPYKYNSDYTIYGAGKLYVN